MKLTQYTVHHRLATGAIVFTLLVLGIYGLIQLPVDLLPNITYSLIKIHIWWRGATPEDINKSIADPIERQMATVNGSIICIRPRSKACTRWKQTFDTV